MGISDTSNDPDLMGAQGRSLVRQASGTSNELDYMDDGMGDYLFPKMYSDVAYKY